MTNMQDTTSTRNSLQVSEKRCPQCNKWLLILENKEQCIDCDTLVGKETKQLEVEMGQVFLRGKELKCLEVFKSDSLVNDRLKNATFENFEDDNENLSKAKVTMRRYANNFSKDNPVPIILMGGYGLGKSHLAYAAVKEIAVKKHTSIFISVPKLLTKIKASYNDKDLPTELTMLEALEKVDCLVLDDIGAEQTKISKDGEVPWSTQKLFEIIDSRIGKHTIFTTNLNYAQLQRHLGPRNFSRLMEGIHVINIVGEDYRLRRFKNDLS